MQVLVTSVGSFVQTPPALLLLPPLEPELLPLLLEPELLPPAVHPGLPGSVVDDQLPTPVPPLHPLAPEPV